jgi:hypothetical protein
MFSLRLMQNFAVVYSQKFIIISIIIIFVALDDGCKNKSDIYFSSGTARRYPHPTLCGFYFTCDPRELDRCTSSYSFNYKTQSCDPTNSCK